MFTSSIKSKSFFSRLERVKRLQDVGGMPPAWATDLTALQTKVQTNAKKAYIAEM